MSLQASSSLPEAILASEDPASEEESSEAVAAPADGAKTEDIDPPEKSENEATAKEKSGGKVEAKSGGKKSKNSYSIAALCQVARLFLCFCLRPSAKDQGITLIVVVDLLVHSLI